MNPRQLARPRTGKIRKFFRPIAMAAMLAVATIMPLKRADAAKERKAKVMKVQKPKWAKEKKKEKPSGPSIRLNLFGGAHHKPVTSPYIGFGGAINQKAGPLSFDALLELSAVSQTSIVLENAAFAVTAPLHGPDKMKNSPLSFTIFTYQERISGVDLSPGATLNVGPVKLGKTDLGTFILGNEIEWPGPIYAGYLIWNKSVTDWLSIKPMLIWVKGDDLALLGGKFGISLKATERWNADAVMFYMTNPSAHELLAINWRLGVSTTF